MSEDVPLDPHLSSGEITGTEVAARVSQTSIEALEVIKTPNLFSDSKVPNFLKKLFETQRLSDANVIFLYSDEIAAQLDDNDRQKLAEVIPQLIREEAHVVFIYEKTNSGGQTRDEIMDLLIKPLGKYGHLVDFSNQDNSELIPADLIAITETTVRFIVETKLLPKPPTNNDQNTLSLEQALQRRLGPDSSIKLISGDTGPNAKKD